MKKHIVVARRFSAVLTTGGSVLILNELFNNGGTIAFFYIAIIASVTSIVGILGLLYFVKCPHCNLKLIQFSLKNKEFSEWLTWVYKVESCPSCGKELNKEKGHS